MNNEQKYLIETLNRDAAIILAEEYPADLIDIIIDRFPIASRELLQLTGTAWLYHNE